MKRFSWLLLLMMGLFSCGYASCNPFFSKEHFVISPGSPSRAHIMGPIKASGLVRTFNVSPQHFYVLRRPQRFCTEWQEYENIIVQIGLDEENFCVLSITTDSAFDQDPVIIPACVGQFHYDFAQYRRLFSYTYDLHFS